MDFSVVNTSLQTVIRLINTVRNNFTNYYTDKSLSEVTKLTRVEPLMVVSKDCQTLEIMPDVAQSILSLFSGYYLQAVDMLTKVQDVEVIKILDRLNPNRDETALMLSAEHLTTMSMETYQHALPGTAARFSMEEVANRENIKSLNEASSLSVGRMLNVTINYQHTVDPKSEYSEKQDKCITIPVSVRLIASLLSTNSIMSILAMKTEDSSLVERFHLWRSGRISFINDLIFCQDMIDEYRRAMLKDEQGTIQEITNRVLNAKKFGLLTKNPSLVTASNIFVITEENARELESKMGGRLSNPRIMNRVFENTYAMIVAVIDRGSERVIFHIRGINTPCDVSFREVKKASQKGPDLTDVIRSLSVGNAPAF